jgi:hypothetical protein
MASAYGKAFQAHHVDGSSLALLSNLERSMLEKNLLDYGIWNPRHQIKLLVALHGLMKNLVSRRTENALFRKCDSLKKTKEQFKDMDILDIAKQLTSIEWLKEKYFYIPKDAKDSINNLKTYWMYKAPANSGESDTMFIMLTPTDVYYSVNNTSLNKFHVALTIGPWYLELNDTYTCIPKLLTEKKFLPLLLDKAAYSITKEPIEYIINKLATVVAEWNLNGPEKTSAEFCDSVLRFLNLSIPVQGALKSFLSRTRKPGGADMIYEPSDKVREDLDLYSEAYIFKTHEELDRFVETLSHEQGILKKEYAGDYAVLQAFDRTFWMRHYADKTKEEWKPLYAKDSVDSTGCPFAHPLHVLPKVKEWNYESEY